MIRFARTGTKVAVLAAVGVTALAACSSSSTPSGPLKAASGFSGIPAPAAKHVAGGTVTFGLAAGATPTYIFPIVPGAQSSVYTISYFQQLMWRPLWWTPVGHSLNINYPLSLAKAPVWSNGNKTVTINMNTGYKWSNGQSVDAQDIIFYIDLLKAAVKLSPANSGNYTPGFFPDNVASAVATSKFTVQLNLTKPYNPGYYFYDQLLLITPLPSTAWNIDKPGGPAVDFTKTKNAEKIYTFLNAQSLKLATYATNPLWQTVDGPFKLSAFNASTDANTMVPNPAYTGPNKPVIKAFQEVAFTSDTAEYTALLDGQLTVGLVPSTDYPQIPQLKKKGYNVFGFPNFGWDYMPFNFKNTTNHWDKVIGQLYVRQALAHLIDSAGYIKGIYHGYAAIANGPARSPRRTPSPRRTRSASRPPSRRWPRTAGRSSTACRPVSRRAPPPPTAAPASRRAPSSPTRWSTTTARPRSRPRTPRSPLTPSRPVSRSPWSARRSTSSCRTTTTWPRRTTSTSGTRRTSAGSPSRCTRRPTPSSTPPARTTSAATAATRPTR
jgi:peptide/nickel transport system substrate-binding protein